LNVSKKWKKKIFLCEDIYGAEFKIEKKIDGYHITKPNEETIWECNKNEIFFLELTYTTKENEEFRLRISKDEDINCFAIGEIRKKEGKLFLTVEVFKIIGWGDNENFENYPTKSYYELSEEFNTIIENTYLDIKLDN
jgi:hypothetical protein